MSIKERTFILAVLVAMTAGIYGLALHYSPLLVAYVVEETLVQKAPDHASRSEIERGLRAHLDSLPDGESRFQRVLAISQYLEKTQKLSQEELDRILHGGNGNPGGEIR